MQCFGRLFAHRAKRPDTVSEHDLTANERIVVFGSYEQFVVYVDGEVASLHSEDGSQADVPLHVLNRSIQLQEAL